MGQIVNVSTPWGGDRSYFAETMRALRAFGSIEEYAFTDARDTSGEWRRLYAKAGWSSSPQPKSWKDWARKVCASQPSAVDWLARIAFPTRAERKAYNERRDGAFCAMCPHSRHARGRTVDTHLIDQVFPRSLVEGEDDARNGYDFEFHLFSVIDALDTAVRLNGTYMGWREPPRRFSAFGTHTGRFSSSRPNLANIARHV